MPQRRPLIFRLTPKRWRAGIFYRYYNPAPKRYEALFQHAALAFAPSSHMVALLQDDAISGSIALTGLYEYELSRRLSRLARKGGLMIDIGANLGYFSILWTAGRPGNSCIAIEASPRNVPLLQQNLGSNGLKNACEVVTVAAGCQSGTMHFDLGPKEQSGWGGLVIQETKETVEVQVQRLDELITGRDPISVVKVDVEGADTWVLRGAETLLRRKQIQTIFYEQHQSRMRDLNIDPAEAEALLTRNGYRVHAFPSKSTSCMEYMATAI